MKALFHASEEIVPDLVGASIRLDTARLLDVPNHL